MKDAKASYRKALELVPGQAVATIGMARAEDATGHRDDAIRRLQTLVDRTPLPGAAVLLGELRAAAGDSQRADDAFALVRATAALQAASGVDVDLDLALFDADHGKVGSDTVERARRAHANRPSIFAADALAWTLHRAGDDRSAVPFVEEALRLGTVDTQLHVHAALIYRAVGDPARARAELSVAASINPSFSVALRPEVQALAVELGVTWP